MTKKQDGDDVTVHMTHDEYMWFVYLLGIAAAAVYGHAPVDDDEENKFRKQRLDKAIAFANELLTGTVTPPELGTISRADFLESLLKQWRLEDAT